MLLPKIDTVSITRASFSRETIIPLRYIQIFKFADLLDDFSCRRGDRRSPHPIGTLF